MLVTGGITAAFSLPDRRRRLAEPWRYAKRGHDKCMYCSQYSIATFSIAEAVTTRSAILFFVVALAGC